VAAAIQVWKTLGYGYLEKVYENALAIELQQR
jgi:GxxExxY protein